MDQYRLLEWAYREEWVQWLLQTLTQDVPARFDAVELDKLYKQTKSFGPSSYNGNHSQGQHLLEFQYGSWMLAQHKGYCSQMHRSFSMYALAANIKGIV